MGIYIALFLSSMRNELYYRSKIVGYMIIWFLRIGILVGIYAVAYKAVGHSVGGMTFQSTVWSATAYFFLLSFGIRHLARDISKDIYHGTIETKLNKPPHYILYWVSERLGRGFPHFLFSGCSLMILLFFVVGFPAVPVSFVWLLQTVSLFFGGAVLLICFYALIGLSAVWLQDSDALYWISDKAVMLLGGGYVPVALFSPTVRTIAESTPFGAGMFISHIFNPDFSNRWFALFSTQILWCILLCLAVIAVYAAANKHISINGG